MQLNKFFKDDLIVLDETFKSKEEALKFLSNLLYKNKYAKDAKKVLELALKREGEFSTGIGGGIAIPHIRDNVMNESVITFAKVKDLNWDAMDGQPVKYIFFISLSAGGDSDHIEIISKLSTLFLDSEFVNHLSSVKSKQSLVKLINGELKSRENEEKVESSSKQNNNYDVVAVTACPTGIAHTFMARDALNKAANEMGVKIKVETEGAEGRKNNLTQEEINNAKGVIIAVDRNVDLSRFTGHENVLEMGTHAVIKDAKKEIQRSLNKEGHKFSGSVKKSDSSESNDDLISFKGFGKRLYKSLMTGVSYMLPFVVFGGILIAIAFLCDIGSTPENNLGMNRNVAKWFKTLGGMSFDLMVPILAAYITFAIVGRQGLLPGFIVGMMAKGNFLFSLDVKTGKVDWFVTAAQSNTATSGIFGAIAGAFLAAAILIVLIKYVFSYMPQSLSGIKNILIIPLFGTLVIATVFWMVNIPLLYVNYGFTEFLNLMEGKNYLAWILGMILGAMMAFDLGGPINKAAYVFATTTLSTQGHGTISMAAAMASGMTPPIGIALCCTFFKRLWSDEERQAGMLNYVMGLTFISEGAIPFTLNRPKVIVTSNVIGGAITGLIIGVLGVSINAPHGGILTVALAKLDPSYWKNLSDGLSIGLGIVFFIAAVLIGAIVEMFAILIFSKIFKDENFNKKSKENTSDSSIINRNKNEELSIKNNLSIEWRHNDIHNNIFTFNRLRYKY